MVARDRVRELGPFSDLCFRNSLFLISSPYSIASSSLREDHGHRDH